MVLTDGSVMQGVVQNFAGGQSLTVQTRDGAVRTVPWFQVKTILPNASEVETVEVSNEAPKTVDWSSRGGTLFASDVQLRVVGAMAYTDHAYRLHYPDGQTMTFTGEAFSGGGGASVGFHAGIMEMAIPDPAEGSTIWALKMTAGIDLGAVAIAHRDSNESTVGVWKGGHLDVPNTQEGGSIVWSTAPLIQVPFSIGGQVGLGGFRGDVWHGALLGIHWVPTYSYVKAGDFDTFSSFNYLGVQATVEVLTISAQPEGKEANLLLSFTYLPRIERNMSLASIGFGAAWY